MITSSVVAFCAPSDQLTALSTVLSYTCEAATLIDVIKWVRKKLGVLTHNDLDRSRSKSRSKVKVKGQGQDHVTDT